MQKNRRQRSFAEIISGGILSMSWAKHGASHEENLLALKLPSGTLAPSFEVLKEAIELEAVGRDELCAAVWSFNGGADALPAKLANAQLRRNLALTSPGDELSLVPSRTLYAKTEDVTAVGLLSMGWVLARRLKAKVPRLLRACRCDMLLPVAFGWVDVGEDGEIGVGSLGQLMEWVVEEAEWQA